MKASELRIGNYLKNKDEICVVSTINCDDTIRIFNDDKTQTFGCFALRIFEPIALTEEWLLKAGFRKVDYEFNVYELNGVEICFGRGYNENENHFHYAIDFDKGNGYSCLHNAIEYVHQLQNLYFALTGKELTFNI